METSGTAGMLREKGLEALRDRFKKNRDYWIPKMQRNVARDDAVTAALQEEGWRVLRYWESDIKKDVPTAARKIARVVRARR